MKRAIRISLHYDLAIPLDTEGDFDVCIKRNKLELIDLKTKEVIVRSGEFEVEYLDYSAPPKDDF